MRGSNTILLLGGLALATGCAGEAVEVYEASGVELWCGTEEPSDNGKLAIELATSRIPHTHTVNAKGGTIAVHVHVIRRDATHGDVPDDSIADQIRVLNSAYESAGWTFELASIERVTNSTWFAMRPGTAAEKSAKAALRVGTARDLNFYTAEPGSGVIGYATFPSQFKVAPQDDGVVMLHSAMPGGSAAPFNLGDQAVHQVGHWLGLYHTYQPACEGNGDYVDDTARSSAAAFGCPVGRDTCGDDGDDGDAVRNYMDATDDACMNAFTLGQRARMDGQFTAYRRLQP